MNPSPHAWLNRSPTSTELLECIDQPLTARQLSRRLRIDLERCRRALKRLTRRALVRCLNPTARRSRLRWLTPEGHEAQALLPTPPHAHRYPNIDYDLYGWLCYSQRSVVVRTLDRPLQPGEIRRRARVGETNLRLNSSNVRDIIPELLLRQIVRQVWVRKQAHPKYALTPVGEVCRELLLRAEVRP